MALPVCENCRNDELDDNLCYRCKLSASLHTIFTHYSSIDKEFDFKSAYKKSFHDDDPFELDD